MNHGYSHEDARSDAEKIIRASSQCMEHWEASIEEARMKYGVLLMTNGTPKNTELENVLSLIREFDRSFKKPM